MSRVSHARAAWEVLAALNAAPATAAPVSAPVSAPETRRPGGKRIAGRTPQAPVDQPTSTTEVPADPPTSPGHNSPAPTKPAAASAQSRATFAGVEESVAPARVEATAEAPAERPWSMEFRRRPLARQLAGLLLLLTLPAAGLTAWSAYVARDVTIAGIALILAVLSLGLWFLRAMSVPVTVTLAGPTLEVRQGDRRLHWNLASPYSPVDHIRGRAGRPGWRAVLRNPDGSTFALDSSMVNPAQFMHALRSHRPEL